jgi:hypothetical protein
MDSLFSILGQKNFDEPPEIAAIKKYIQESFQSEASVLVRDKDIIVSVTSSSLAATLRLRGPDMKRRCNIIDKRLSFRTA